MNDGNFSRRNPQALVQQPGNALRDSQVALHEGCNTGQFEPGEGILRQGWNESMPSIFWFILRCNAGLSVRRPAGRARPLDEP